MLYSQPIHSILSSLCDFKGATIAETILPIQGFLYQETNKESNFEKKPLIIRINSPIQYFVKPITLKMFLTLASSNVVE